jgi:predicted glycoside hydrolase/deacetylase ChbG (UPF0249 family)
VLSSATLMARAAATDEAIELALANPSLGVGCHVVLVDGMPVLPPAELPNLTAHLTDGSAGSFCPTLSRFLRKLYNPAALSSVRAALRREIEAESIAQIRLLQSRGVRLTHIDTHKHTHMFPAVLRPVLRAARACGIMRIRNPFDSAWSRRTAAGVPLLRRAEVAALAGLEARVHAIVAEEGFSTTDGTLGVLITGSLNANSLRRTLAAMPEGVWELVTHPGYHDADLEAVRTRLRASREIERQSLAVIREFPDIKLCSYADLDAPATRRS